jgi:hypothetical protein
MSLCRLQGFAPIVNPYRRWIVTSDANSRSPPELALPLQGIFRVSDHATRHVSRSCALAHLLFKQPAPDKSESDLGKDRVRFSGFARNT